MSFNGLEIKEIRSRMRLNQTDFGKMLGVGLRIVQRWEKGERDVSPTIQLLLDLILKDKKEAQPVKDLEPPIKRDDFQEEKSLTDISERFNEIMIQKNLNYSSLGDIIGYSDVAVGKIIKGKNKPKFEAIKSVLESFPDVSAKWLVLGVGDMRCKLIKEKELKDFHPLEIVEHIDKEQRKFSRLRLFQKLILSFVNKGVIDDLERELAEDLESGKLL